MSEIRSPLVLACMIVVVVCLGGCGPIDTTIYHTYVPKSGPDENFTKVKELMERQIAAGRPLPAELVRAYETAINEASRIHPDHAEVQVLQARYEQLKVASEEADVPADAWPKEFVDPIGIEYVLIPAGTFTMGSNDGGDDERPPHEVTISRPFYMGRYEVTQAQWQAVMGTNPSSRRGNDYRPVDCVTWNDCQGFCKRLSAKTGTTARLPTEAEWEYACRAGSTGNFCFGDSYGAIGEFAWCGDFFYALGTQPVGQKKANAWGLQDMHGNVWEWCADRYGSYARGPQTDPHGASSGDGRVLRGGGCYFVASGCRSAFRRWFGPDFLYYDLGLRVAVETQ